MKRLKEADEVKTVCHINECAGCMACVEMCPKAAIHIQDDLMTLNAVIDKDKCIDCGLCHSLCQENHHAKFNAPTYWKQGWASSNKVRMASSSGGIASAIERAFIKNGGCVCSCIYTNQGFGFDFVEQEQHVYKFSGSKYVKSNPYGIYHTLKLKLKADEKVLFVGLPCQVAAIKNLVGEDLQKGLYTIDLICHGTPSVEILKIFLKQYGLSFDDLYDIRFRTKNIFSLTGNHRFIAMPGTRDRYSMAFLNGLIYTDNCYNCQYAKLQRVSDITLGDCWGSELNRRTQEEGISLILCQTEKGKALLEHAELELYDVDLGRAVEYNLQLRHPSVKPKCRESFFKEIKKGKKFNKLIVEIYPRQCFKQFVKGILIKAHIIVGNNM